MSEKTRLAISNFFFGMAAGVAFVIVFYWVFGGPR